VSQAGSVKVEKLMEVERYSHVMHISSTGAVLLAAVPHLAASLGGMQPWLQGAA
jgi:hypothetical protein